MNKGPRRLFNIILALLVSIGGWMFVTYNYYPMTDVSYSEIPITFNGERDLADRGLAVSEVESVDVKATINQKRVEVKKYSSSDMHAYADVSNCVAGDNNVSLSVNSPSDTSVQKYGPDSVKVTVDRTDSAVMDIAVVYAPGAPEDAEPIASDLSRMQAEVVCAANKLPGVSRIAAVLDYDEVGDKSKSYTATLVALDKNGDVVPHAIIYPEEISLDASSGVKKTVPLNVTVNDTADDNYDRKYTAPETVTIKGAEDAISKILSVNAHEIDVRYIYEDSEIPIEYDLPEGVYPALKSEGAVLKLTVTKKASEDKNKTNSDS